MGHHIGGPEEIDGLEVKAAVQIKGQCPMCETKFDVALVSQDGHPSGTYGCPCGYFRYDAGSNTVTRDGHNVPKKEWKRRLAENLKQKSANSSPQEGFIKDLNFRAEHGGQSEDDWDREQLNRMCQ